MWRVAGKLLFGFHSKHRQQTTDDNDNGHDDHLVDDVLDAAVVVDKDAGRNFTAKLLLLFIAK